MMDHVVVEHVQAQRPLRSYHAIALRETIAACRSLDRDAPAPRNHTKFRGRWQIPSIEPPHRDPGDTGHGPEAAQFGRTQPSGVHLGIIPLDESRSSTSMYYRDPDGNQIELKIENFPTIQEQRAWLRTKEFAENPTDTQFDPDQLAAQFPTGAPAEVVKSDLP